MGPVSLCVCTVSQRPICQRGWWHYWKEVEPTLRSLHHRGLPLKEIETQSLPLLFSFLQCKHVVCNMPSPQCQSIMGQNGEPLHKLSQVFTMKKVNILLYTQEIHKKNYP